MAVSVVFSSAEWVTDSPISDQSRLPLACRGSGQDSTAHMKVALPTPVAAVRESEHSRRSAIVFPLLEGGVCT
jgi:hypothetical protein